MFLKVADMCTGVHFDRSIMHPFMSRVWTKNTLFYIFAHNDEKNRTLTESFDPILKNADFCTEVEFDRSIMYPFKSWVWTKIEVFTHFAHGNDKKVYLVQIFSACLKKRSVLH